MLCTAPPLYLESSSLGFEPCAAYRAAAVYVDGEGQRLLGGAACVRGADGGEPRLG